MDKIISRIKKEIKPEHLPDLTFDFHKQKNIKHTHKNIKPYSSNSTSIDLVHDNKLIIK